MISLNSLCLAQYGTLMYYVRSRDNQLHSTLHMCVFSKYDFEGYKLQSALKWKNYAKKNVETNGCMIKSKARIDVFSKYILHPVSSFRTTPVENIS